MATIAIEGARKRYGDTDVLHGVDLDVADGEFIVLVGPSGCGKSTLLRMIAGLEEITSGTIRIGERIVNDLAPRERDIAMVFQSYALYPHMNVADNMSYSLRLKRATKATIDTAVAGASRILGLDPYLARRPKALSGGQRQRVAMGRAIVREPRAFLFDEPLSNLDARLREEMRAEIRQLHKRLGATSIYVTHDQIEAMTMADRIVAMHDGIVQQVGTPLELYDRPANTFVAGFIGAPMMNFIEGTVAGDRLTLASGTTLTLPAALPGASSVTVGVRPEDVELAAPGADGVIAATATLVEHTGLTCLVHGEAGGVRVTALTLERPKLAEGAAVGFAFDPGKLHLFDAQSGARLN